MLASEIIKCDPRSIFDLYSYGAQSESNFSQYQSRYWQNYMTDSDMGLSRACSLNNSLQDDMHFETSVPLLSLRIARGVPKEWANAPL